MSDGQPQAPSMFDADTLKAAKPIDVPATFDTTTMQSAKPIEPPKSFDSDTMKTAKPIVEEKKTEEPTGLWGHLKAAVAGPTTALATPLGETHEQELSGLSDILHGEFAAGGKKLWNAEKIDASHITPGSPIEWAIRQFDPDFKGGATKEAIELQKAKNPNAGERPLIDVAQFVDLKKHPIGKAIAEVGQGFTSPENIAIMYGTGGLGLLGKTPQAMKAFGVANRLISAGFSYQALQNAYQHSKAFKDAFDAGDVERAEYEITHAVLSGTIATQAATHAAEGAPLPGYDAGGKGRTVQPLVQLSPTEQRIAGAISGVTSRAADATKDFAKDKFQAAADRVNASIGKADNIPDTVVRVANMLGKKAGPEFREKVNRAEGALTKIVNDDTSNRIVDPKSAADAIDRYRQAEIEAPLQAKAGAERNSVEPVVPDFMARLKERLDKFFDDNKGTYGSTEEEEAIKQRIIDRMMRSQDLGNGVKIDREPNLFEAENIRQGLNKSAGDVFEHGTSSGWRAASADSAKFMREIIDDAYKAKGVRGVPEARRTEADLIDIRDALHDAQGRFEAQQATPAILKMFSMGKMLGMIGTLGAHLLGSDVLGGAVAAGTLWKTVHEHNVSSIEGNIERMKELAARAPNAQGATPQTGQPPIPPPPGPAAPPAPGMPSRPTPPPPATPPAINHRLNGELSSYFGSFLNEEPYNDLMQRFTNQVADMKQDIASKGAKKYTQDQINRAMQLQAKINAEHAKEAETVEKENQKRQTAHQKEVAKWEEKNREALAKIEAEKAAKKDLETQAAAQEKADRTKAILADERVAHSPLMKSLDEALPIEGVEGRSSKQNHRHEHGHLMANVAEGLNPIAFVTGEHPDAIENNAVAQIHTDVSGAEEGAKGIAQRVVGILGGPAFDEAHQNISLAKNTGARGDIARARQILREEGGLRGNQLEKVFDALYDRAKEHVSNPEALALVEANADLREAGLHKNFHMSPGRLEEYVNKLKGAYRNGETPSTEGVRKGDSDGGIQKGESDDTGVSGQEQDGTAEGVRAQAARESNEGGGREERSGLKKPAVPPKRTTGKPEVDEAIEKGGAIPGGVMKGDTSIGLPELTMFHDPESGTTLALKSAEGVTPEKVAEKLKASRAEYAKYKQPEQSSLKADHDEVLEGIKRSYGVHDNPKLDFYAGFITPEGRYIDLPSGVDHSDAIENHGGGPAEGAEDNRRPFINESGAIRVHKAKERAGNVLAFSVPKGGVRPEQAEAIEKSVGANADRNGVLRIERADVSAENKKEATTEKDFPRTSDVRSMLQKIGALKGIETSALNKDVANAADKYNKSAGRPEIDAEVKPHDVNFAKRVADAYDAMKHDPNDPAVQKAYNSMAQEVKRQWDYASGPMGIKFEPWTKEGQPYANSKEMAKDVANNKHLYFFQGGDIKPESPMAKTDPDTGLSYNDMFRAVHDLFGHAAHGFEFGPKGEENAYLVHRQMFPAEAIPALTSETRGQNSWVNFGQHLRNEAGEVPKKGEAGYISPAERPYAEQKVGLLPEEFHGESSGNRQKSTDWAKQVEDKPFGGVNPNNPEASSKKYGFELLPENRHTPENLTAEEARAYAERPDVKAALAAHPDIKLGWDATTGGRPELNVGISTDDLAAAKKVAGKLDQRAIVDTQTGDEIPAGGKGEKTAFPEYPLEQRLADLGIEQSALKRSPKGSSVPLMEEPLEVQPGKGREEINTLDLTKALNAYTRKQLPALEPGSESKEMVARVKKIAEDEAKYQLAQSKTGTEWYTTEMKDHDNEITKMRPELLTGPESKTGTPWPHTAKMTLFKAAEAILSSGQKPYANVKSALKAWDVYNETGEFPPTNPAPGKEGKSWGPRNTAAYGSAFDSLNRLIKEKGEKGAADWLLSEHPIKELRSYQSGSQTPVKGKAADMETGAMILGAKRGPFMQNLHGIESKFTADMWVSRSWNRWMGTLDLDPRIEPEKGKVTSTSDSPRNDTERSLMRESFAKTADKLGLTTSSLQAVLWYYEQALYRVHGLPVESWSFSDAAKRVAKEQPSEEEQTSFGFGENPKAAGVAAGLAGIPRQEPGKGRVSAVDVINALKRPNSEVTQNGWIHDGKFDRLYAGEEHEDAASRLGIDKDNSIRVLHGGDYIIYDAPENTPEYREQISNAIKQTPGVRESEIEFRKSGTHERMKSDDAVDWLERGGLAARKK